MPIASNPDTGDNFYLDAEGKWRPAKTAADPEKKKVYAFDALNNKWESVDVHGKGVNDHLKHSKDHGWVEMADHVIRAVASGATFGYADEFAAKMDELTGRGGTYEQNLRQERAKDASIPAAIRIPGEIAGGVMGAVATAPLTAAAGAATGFSRLPMAAKMIGGGAVAGGLYASGESEGGLANRLAAVPAGAAIGALTGGVIAGGTRVAQHAFNPRAAAQYDIARALGRDETTPEAVQVAGRALSADRPGATLADVGGENVRGLTERVSQTPGAGRTTTIPFLNARQQGQAERVADDLSSLTGTKKSAFAAVAETMAERQKEGKPLYDAAMNFNARADADIAAAWEKATSSGWGKSILESPELKKNLQSEYGVKDISLAPLMVQIDAWKKVADDAIGAAVRTGSKNTARTIGDVRDGVLDIVRTKNPAYEKALSAWAGKSSYLQAIEDGKGIAKIGAEELGAKIANLGASQQEGFRIGAVSAIVSKMGNDPAKLADMTKYLRSPEMRKKVAAIMPTPEAAAAWQRRLNFEVSSSELVGKSLSGSQTARRLAEMQDSSIVGDLVMDAFSGAPPVSLLRRLVIGGGRGIRDTLRSRTDREVAKVLTSPQSLQNLPAVLQQRGRLNPSPALGAGVVGANAGISGGMANR